MNEEQMKEVKKRMHQICDAFSALEFAYRNYDGSKDASDIVAIIGVSTTAGMSAFESLSSALDKVERK
ncbi:UNVERIFIED_ORG: translation initiation factor IF-2 [Pantoea agglomerans]